MISSSLVLDSNSDDDEYCGKRSREQFYFNNTSDHYNYEYNIKKSKLNDHSLSSPTILILDSNINLNNIKCDYFQFLKSKFAKQQLGKKLWLENRELKYEYIPIEFSKDKQFIMNFIKFHENKPSKSPPPSGFLCPSFYATYLKELCWNQISDELKNDIDMILNFAIYNEDYLNTIYRVKGSQHEILITDEHLKIIDNYLNNCKDQEEQFKIIIKIIANMKNTTSNKLNIIEKMFTFTKSIKTNEKLLLKIFNISNIHYDITEQFDEIDISLQNDRNFIFNSILVNYKLFHKVDPKYYDDKELVINLIKNLQNSLEFEAISKEISDRLKQDKDVILECGKKRFDILEYSNDLYMKIQRKLNINRLEHFRTGSNYCFPDEVTNDREYALQLLEHCGTSLKYFSNEIKSDRELVLLAMKNGGFLTDASKEFQNDREIVLESIKSNSYNIVKCSEAIRNDRETVLEAIKSNSDVLRFAPEQFRNDKEIILQRPSLLLFASKKLFNDREFIFEIIEQVEKPQLILTDENENIISDAIDKFGTRAICTTISKKLPKHLCLKIVKIDGLFLNYLSDDMKSDIEIVEQAIDQNPLSIFYSRLESEKDKKNMLSKAVTNINEKYSIGSIADRKLLFKLKDENLAFKLVKYNPLAIHYLHKCNNTESKVGFEATFLENGYWMKFSENHFQERIIHKYYGAKIENNENEINYYKNRNNEQLLWSNDYKFPII